jgi:hypothetical protein
VLFASAASASQVGDFNRSTIHMNGEDDNIRLGGNGHDGDIVLYANDATSTDVTDFAKAAIWLDGDQGDIKLQGGDCAEYFDVANPTKTPGTLMVAIDGDRLEPCGTPYDKRAVGVMSGAGAYRPGLILNNRGPAESRAPIALAGRVMCKVDAGYGRIEVGDLLTSSGTPGHAMKAEDRSRAFGAVIGKALGSLEGGCGLLPILVALQ